MKAVIKVGGKQYIVAEKEVVTIDKLTGDAKTLELEPLMIFDKDSAKVGTPIVKDAKVSAKVTAAIVAGDKIKIAKFEAKKRVKKITGHRQKYTQIEITKISV